MSPETALRFWGRD